MTGHHSDMEGLNRVVNVMFGLALGAIPLAACLASALVVFVAIARCGKVL